MVQWAYAASSRLVGEFAVWNWALLVLSGVDTKLSKFPLYRGEVRHGTLPHGWFRTLVGSLLSGGWRAGLSDSWGLVSGSIAN
jgi:hypothetical protein